MSESKSRAGPSIEEIRRATEALRGRIVSTPTVPLVSDRVQRFLPDGAAITVKLELFQHAGSFKSRSVLLRLDALNPGERLRGVTAVSAGNHALAVAWASKHEGIRAKLLMPKTADPMRIDGCLALDAEVILLDDIHVAFEEMDRVVEEEARIAIHPFEGEHATLGAATCGLELITQHPDLHAVVVPVGGGGLISGVARSCRLISPDCRVIGVEPVGADTLYRSFEAGTPVSIPKLCTIADSLGSPTALPYSYEIARANVDSIVRIEDDEMLLAMVLLYDALKIVAEPACAAATAAVLGPLREELRGKNVGVIACGSNIGEQRFVDFLAKGRSLMETRGHF